MRNLMNQSAGEWTPDRIKRLRGRRTQEAFGKLIRVPKNTVWRWEAGYARPDAERLRRLSTLAVKERARPDWKLAGSAVLLGDLEDGSGRMARLLAPSLRRSARQLE